MQRPSFIGNYLDFLEDDISCYSTSGSSELLSIGSAVGKKLGLVKIGIHIETLLPGRRTSWPHAESEEEEFAFVIEGNPHVWIDGEIFPLKPGDFVAFPSGTGISHTFINNSSTPVRLLVSGEANKETNKIIYPLHPERNKYMASKNTFWADAPAKKLGPHPGVPEKPTSQKWNIPQLETSRLILRPLELSDAPAIFAYASKPEVAHFVTWPAHKTMADTEAYLHFAFSSYAQGMLEPLGIVLKENPSLIIGTIGAFWSSKPHKIIELGAVLDNLYWGNGFVAEALAKLVEVSWEHYDVNRIQGRCSKLNTRSASMMKKLGMKHEGTLYQSFMCKGECWDMEMFSLTKKGP